MFSRAMRMVARNRLSTVRSAGDPDGSSSKTGAGALTLQPGQLVDSLMVMFVATANQDAIAPTGWTHVYTTAGIGTPGLETSDPTTCAIRLTVFKKVQTAPRFQSMIVPDSGARQTAWIYGVMASDIEAVTGVDGTYTTGALPSVTTLGSNRMILQMMALTLPASSQPAGGSFSGTGHLNQPVSTGAFPAIGGYVGLRGIAGSAGLVAGSTFTMRNPGSNLIAASNLSMVSLALRP